MKNFILGGSGLVGSALANQLLRNDEEVVVIDRNSPTSVNADHFSFFKADLVSERVRVLEWIREECKQKSEFSVWHLAANSDIRSGIEDPFVDYHDTLGTTLTAIQICKTIGAQFLGFSSSSAVYGDMRGMPVSETMDKLVPISHYGWTKLWSEQLIASFVGDNPPLRALIFRFPNVVGLPLTHGILKDLFEKLIKAPQALEVLGDGKQRKQYIHVEDLVQLLLKLRRLYRSGYQVLNLAPRDQGVLVQRIAEDMRNLISPETRILYGNTPFGWKGDVPVYYLDSSKLRQTGYGHYLNSQSAIDRTLREIRSTLL